MTQLPTHVSHYEIRRVLGQGGMGTVYLAMDPALQRQVALKVLRADTEDQRERFRREARIVARLQHPNIVAIYAVGEHEQQPFIAMEYIEGEPLSDGIRRRAPWSLQRKLQMGADLCAGLAFAHRAGVVHRDVKPSNLMVSNGSGVVRLLDFGIARGVDAAATMGLTMLGNIVGTLNYMSPEQITGQALDHRSDIFAVGLVLYELLAYRQAFPGDNLATLTYHIVHGSAQPLRVLQPDLPSELCDVVERAMARSPEDRYPHLEAMRTDLLRVVARLSPETGAQLTAQGATGNTPASGQPLIWSHALDATVSADGPATPRSTARVPEAAATVAADAQPTRARWPLAAGALGLVVTGAALAAWLTLGRSATPPATPPTQTNPTVQEAGAQPTAGAPSSGPADAAGASSRDAGPAPDADPRPPVLPGATPPAGRTEKGPTTVPSSVPTGAAADPRSGAAAAARTEEPAPAPPAPVVPPVTDTGARGPATSGVADAGSTPPPVATPPPPVAAPTGPSDEELVQSALTRWARAYAARDARGVDELQPGTERALAQQFGQLQSVDLSLSDCRIMVQKTRATADCAERFSAQTKVGGRRLDESRRRVFSLDKSSGAWRIASTQIAR